MLRIAIATLAVTMIVAPLLALGAAAPSEEPAAEGRIIISQDQALALAKAHGLARVTNIVFTDGVWIVHGAARSGATMEVDISDSGDVLNPMT